MVQTILAQTALEIARDSLYFYEPQGEEEEHEERQAAQQFISNSSDNFLLDNIPNPYKDETTIRTTVTGVKNELYVTDMYGKIIFSKLLDAGYNEVIFSGSGITAGIYYYSIISDGHILKTKRMCIIK